MDEERPINHEKEGFHSSFLNRGKTIASMAYQRFSSVVYVPQIRAIPTDRIRKSLANAVNVVTKEKILETEPMAMLGFGIISYMQLLQYMQRVFLGLTILQLPAIYIYS